MAGAVAQHEVMAGEGLERADGQNGAGQALPPPPPRPPTEQLLALAAAEQKAAKSAKKAAKQACCHPMEGQTDLAVVRAHQWSSVLQ